MMADVISTTRRSLLVGALTAPALALPAMATDLPPQQARFNIVGRPVLVDTDDLPIRQITEEREPDGIAVKRIWSVPEPGAEYVVLTWDSELCVRALVEGEVLGPGNARRAGFVETTATQGWRMTLLVTVIGKVIG